MENLGVDFKLLIAQVVNFILFFIIISKFIVRPFMVFLDQERKKDKEKEDALAKIKSSEESIVNEQSKAKLRSKKELDIILDQAKKDGILIKQEILEDAKKEAENIKLRMKEQLNEEKENLYKDIKKQITDLSTQLVEQALRDNLDEESKKKITQRILRNLSSKSILPN